MPEKRGFKMLEEVGRFFSPENYPASRWVVFFHPAYILRDPRKKGMMTEHIRQFVAAWRSES
jgi:uracil-DNA glycosylase